MDNPLKKFFASNPLQGLFQSKSATESVVGIDIGSSSIKAVQIKKKAGRAVLETYGAIALGPYAQTDIGAVTNLTGDILSKAIIDVIKESSITTKDGGISIPSSASLVFVISLPATIGDADLTNVVQTEARKYIPVPITEVSLDFWRIPKDEFAPEGIEEKIEVLVVAIHKETITKYQEMVTKSELSTDFFELEIFSSIRSVWTGERMPALLMDLGASKTKLSIVEHGIIKQFHVVNRGAVDITNGIATAMNVPFSRAEELKRQYGLIGDNGEGKTVSDTARISIDYILGETNSVLLNYEKKYNKPVTKVILIGGGAMLQGIKDAAAEQFRINVVQSDPFAKVEAPAFLTPVLAATGPEFAVALGLALRKLQ